MNRDKDISLFAPRDFIELPDEVEATRLELLANWLNALLPDMSRIETDTSIDDYYNYM